MVIRIGRTGLEAPDDDDAVNEELLKRVKENFGRNGPKVDKKLAVEQVPSFGPSAARSHARSFGNAPRATSSSTAVGTGPQDGGGESSAPRVEKEYVDHWRYYSYYPSLLPLRRPYSGDPEILDEQEFGEASANADHDESRINPAEELGLMEEKNGEMLLFQLPASLPLVKRSASAKDKETADGSEPSTKEKTDGLEPSTKEAADGSKPSRRRGIPEKGCRLEELPAGFMGKMLVYKSGAVKMKLGDTLFDVSPGSNCVFAQDVAAINPVDKHCCILGELNKRAIVTPDVDSLLDGISNLE
ncbi:DNA-directed RNA polymerase III subunit rpc4-like [Magnolia sinica]|uniref:DNA-directed RNA polymerase III subunit rpc4-like n=1 Tax=Magnolia sinica TaxID=86752 RepID=UPI002659A487|nr:DNA-directed RNA polymerase III subunit rpc4-like [Magnolia sinica]